MKLHLGCGNDIRQGYINHDLIKHREEIDIVFDLEEKNWHKRVLDRFGDILCDEIFAGDVIEHLDSVINFMDNCWELMNPEGVLKLKACGWQNPNVHVDITHRRGFDIKSFDYFVPATVIGKEYPYYTNKKWKYVEGFPKYDRRMNVLVEMIPIK